MHERLAQRSRAPRPEAWQPRLYALADARDEGAVAALLDDATLEVHDTIEEQLAGLVETRNPTRTLPKTELVARVREQLGGAPHRYGTWVHYPWLRRLVHVLPEAEFRELRTSRNRNKITLDEQQKLRALRLGIVGLSVGQATAVTLALEEIGGLYRLADFDRLELSNMNRLRTGVHELGARKVHITAREIYEINPYARVEVFERGLDDENIDAFFRDLDIVYDECDDLAMKVRIREKARALRIPVLMETSDRGLIDVERFDREPQRPMFHGLAGELRAEDLKGLTTYEKVPTVMKIIGQTTMSERMAASLIDVDTTLKTWPQLASAIALGGALNTDATRRLCLGTFEKSGRFFVDLEQLVSDERARALERSADYRVEVSEHAKSIQLPFLRRVAPGEVPSAEQITALVSYGAMAPSGGNCQPWRFVSRGGGELLVFHERARSQNFLDFADTGSQIAFGALAETIELAAKEMGLRTRTEAYPADARDGLVLRFRFRGEPGVIRDPLVEFVGARCSNRRIGTRVLIDRGALEQMSAAAHGDGATIRWITDDAALLEIADILGRGDRMRFASKVMHRELMNEVRWTKDEVERTRDGLDVATLELTPTDLAGMRLVSSWGVMAMARHLGGGAGLEKPSRKSIAAASAVGLMTIEGTSPADYVRGGRGLQRAWLTATREEIAFQPMTAITFLFTRLERGAEGLARAEKEELGALFARYRALFGLPQRLGDVSQVMLFRVARTGPPSARSLRRNVSDLLTFA